MQQELLNLDGRPLYSFKDGEAQLYRDDHSQGPRIPLDWPRSGVGFLHTGPTNCNIRKFREHVAGIVVIGLIRKALILHRDKSRSYIHPHSVSWYVCMELLEVADSHHHYFIYYSLEGKKTSVKTKTSHGQRQISDDLIAKMARQLKVSRSVFLNSTPKPKEKEV